MIPMGLNTDDLTFLVGDPERLRQMSGTPALPAFSERAVTFLSSLSRLLLRDKRSSVDVKSYAYWIRRASLEAAAREGDYLLIPMTDDERIADLGKQLYQENIPLYRIEKREKSLEDIFLSLTGKETSL